MSENIEPDELTQEDIDNLINDPFGRSEITQLELNLLDHINSLQSENKRYREALERIANEKEIHEKFNQVRLCCKWQDIANKALNNKQGNE